MISAGAVNGVPAQLNVSTPGSLSIPYATDGVAGTLSVQPRDTPHAPVGSGPDRVAIIGGSTVGRDHFPFAVADIVGLSGDATERPIARDTEGMCRWFYRIRKWRFTMEFDYTAHFPDDDPRVGAHDGVGSLSFDFAIKVLPTPESDTFTPARESDLVLPNAAFNAVTLGVCAADGTAAVISDYSGQDGYDISNLSGSASYLITDQTDPGSLIMMDFVLSTGANFLTNTSTNLQLDTNSFLPYFRFAYTGRDASSQGLTDSHPAPFTENMTDVRIETLLGGFPQFNVYSLPDPGGTDYTYISFEQPIFIQPIEYWPYATKAGLPVYDTSTGAQLRDPFS